MKEKIKTWLTEWGYQFEDMGAFEYDEEDDYPDFVMKAAQMVSADTSNSRGIILGATGQGEAIVANRYKGVRAVVFYGGPEEIVRLARLHNDANVISMGAAPGNTIAEGKPLDDDLARRVVKLFLETDFLGEPRHKRRISKIEHE